MIEITNHAKKRIIERKGKKVKPKHDATNAWYRGVSPNDIQDRGFKIFLGRYDNRILKLYDGFVYLFTPKQELITVIHVPKKYIAHVKRKPVKKQSKNYINRRI